MKRWRRKQGQRVPPPVVDFVLYTLCGQPKSLPAIKQHECTHTQSELPGRFSTIRSIGILLNV